MAKFAKRIANMQASADVIRQLFESMTDPETISFGGGAPAREALPVELVHDIASEVLTRDKRGIQALQYGNPTGIPDLRRAVTDRLLAPKGLTAGMDNVLIVSGGIESMNLVSQLYLEPGDVVLVEAPTFVQAVQIFQLFEARCIACETDDNGLVIEDVEAKIKKYSPKMVYVIPTFQNPSGRTTSLERRKALAELGSRYDVIILEDDPYSEMRYSGTKLPPIKSFDKTGNTIFVNSFSKIFSPGSRLGYIFASEEIIRKVYDVKTATNSHASVLAQIICAEFFNRGLYDAHLKRICDIHRERRDVMMDCIAKMLPDSIKAVYPDGGLFTWVELPQSVNTTALLGDALAQKVAYVPGREFFVEDRDNHDNCMRISFGGVEPEKICIGMERLARVIKARL
ncbi:PLP-dependent aminotransferase family protein [Leptolinea tardivitalis]|uniref:Aminotransferase n=1 Tax=Leptolinea tardivitalis TaxID=229920 RepID=A0A0P6X7Q1_9CHLR|nr:PLP-dependent aminotransferase family protein [Leptolinea tardivitalis]KPL70190.1 aminotransferase [Leptolinea tardivitalis]GAP21720.1 transcriptional regulator [Leptolinea tardivitalis]